MIVNDTFILQAKEYFLALQQEICQRFGRYESEAVFQEDAWSKSLGSGVTCVLSGGSVIEQAGVNFSFISGSALPSAASESKHLASDTPFQATGISVIVHPRNPYIPTSHFNLRLFLVHTSQPMAWFGGGFDLTPYYGFKEDAIKWHQAAKDACDPFESGLYLELKKRCDEYFFLKHRQEPRGIGGLFFDDFDRFGSEKTFEFIQKVGAAYVSTYESIMARRYQMPFSERERTFQKFRRGRYVEFNLLYDRGTAFGLKVGGRTESILISLPPEVSWRYHFDIVPGSPEEQLYQEFLVAKDWLAEEAKEKG